MLSFSYACFIWNQRGKLCLKTSKAKYVNTTRKIRKPASIILFPEVVDKLKQQRIDSETITPAQVFPECLDSDGNDLSFMSCAEWDIMITYAKTRKYRPRGLRSDAKRRSEEKEA